MTTKAKLQRIAEQEVVRGRFDGRIKLDEHDEKPNFSGSIDSFTLSTIEVTYNPTYKEEAEKEKLEEKLGVNPLEETVRAIFRHEINHKGYGDLKGCPRNVELYAEEILEPIAKVLSKKGIPDSVCPSTGVGLYHYFANAFMDWIDNIENLSKSRYLGEWLFYHDVGNHAQNKKFTKFYEAFVRLQVYTTTDNKAKKLVNRHFTHDEKVNEVLLNFLERTGIKDMKTTSNDPLEEKLRAIQEFSDEKGVETNWFELNRTEEFNEFKEKIKSKSYRDPKQILNHITNEENWYSLATIFAEEFSELIDPSIDLFLLPLMGKNEFEEEMKKPETLMRLVWRKYKKSGKTFEPPSYLENFEALNYVYKKEARNLEIKVKAHTRSEKMPVAWYGRKKFDPKKDRGKRIRPYVEDGKVELGVGKHPYEIDISIHSRPIGLPAVQFVMLDTSGSMQEELEKGGKVMNPWAEEDMQWTDTSKYHYALVSYYGLVELLQKHGVLKRTNMNFANFSSSTELATDLDSAMRLALSPQFGSTNLDMDSVDKIFSKKGMLTMTMSDGEISNWNSIKNEFIEKAKKNHYFHIQIGEKNKFCIDLEEAGLPVYYDTGKNLPKLVVDLTTPVITRYKK